MTDRTAPLRVLHLSYSDTRGGAARAAYRLHRGLLDAGVDSEMWVQQASRGDPRVRGPDGFLDKAVAQMRRPAGRQLERLLRTGNNVLHSPATLPSRWASRINASNADVVNLHWVNYDMVSVRAIGQIRKPLVWTLHDMWAFCGAEHHTDDDRWQQGYEKGNRPGHESGFDLNRWTWNRKRRYWKQPFQIVTPSRWLADCVRESALMAHWPVTVIPNYLDLNRWQGIDRKQARRIAGLPLEAPLLLFGAIGGGGSPFLKGFDLLQEALSILRQQPGALLHQLELVIVGGHRPLIDQELSFPTHYMGELSDDIALRVLMSAADAVVIPSRRENFPNVAVEAIACGTPVAAFDVGGVGEIVVPGKSGALATPGSSRSLADAIREAISGAGSFEPGLSPVADAVKAYLDCYERVRHAPGPAER